MSAWTNFLRGLLAAGLLVLLVWITQEPLTSDIPLRVHVAATSGVLLLALVIVWVIATVARSGR